MTLEKGPQQKRGEKIEENAETALTTVKIYGERFFIEIRISGQKVIDQEEIPGLSAGQVSPDVLQEAAKRSIEGQTGEKLRKEMSELAQNLREIKELTQVIIPPELDQQFLEEILEPATESEILTPESIRKIRDLISLLKLSYLSVEEIRNNKEDFSRFKREIIDRFLEVLDNNPNLENYLENWLRSIISRGISTLENIQNIISKIKDNKLDEAIKMLITTISNAMKERGIKFNEHYYSIFVRPIVAAACDRFVIALSNEYALLKANSTIGKISSIIQNQKNKEEQQNNNGGNN